MALITVNGSEKHEIFIRAGAVLLAKRDAGRFYQQAANCSADTIYLGEAVCSKRRATKVGDWIEMAKTLAASGKQVVLSTLALVQASSELGELKRYVDNGEFLIEASDLGVVKSLRRTQATVRRRACAELLQRRHPAPAAETGHGALVHAGGTLPRLAG